MNVWLVKVGEPMPTGGRRERPHRMGILAERLVAAGHQVTWWCSTFDHAKKTHVASAMREEHVAERFALIQLHGRPYRRNISVARILNHRDEAAQFAEAMERRPRPDVIVCAYPTIDLSLAAVRFGERHGIPVVLDVRDLWPDIFADVLPTLLRPPARQALSLLARGKQRAFRGATAVVGTSESFVDWGLEAAGRARTPRDRAFPHGYPVAALSATQRDEARTFWHGLFGGAFPKNVICFFGNFSHHVLDLGTVIDAARSLESSGDDVTFVLCGSGPVHAEIVARAKGMHNVLIPGRVDAAQIKLLMEHSRAGLLPYEPRWDFTRNLPNKAIEYLSAGLPVLTCLTGEVATMIQRHGCGAVYRNREVPSLVAEVRTLLADDAGRAARAQAARELFDSTFDADGVYARYVAHLEMIAGHTGVTP